METFPVILQLSDTQFGPRFGFKSYVEAVESLAEDIDRLENEKIPKPNIIVHCGDIADTGKSGEYQRAKEFLGELCAHIGIERNKCIIVPGNHDYDLNSKEGLNFKNYRNFFRSFYDDNYEFSNERTIFDLSKEFSIVFFAWNSSQKISKENMKDTKIDTDQLKQKMNELNNYGNDIVKIFVTHHNLLSTCETDHIPNGLDVLNILSERGINICLHGHLHDNFFHWHIPSPSTPQNKRVLLIGTGSISASKEERPGELNLGVVPNQYNILMLDKHDQYTSIYARQHIPTQRPRGKWTKYCIFDGNVDRVTIGLDDCKIVHSKPFETPSHFTQKTKIILSKPWHWSAIGCENEKSIKTGLHILALSPHPDDIIQSCGATLMKLREKANAKIWIYNISPIRASTMAHVNRCVEAAISSQFILKGMKKDELLDIIEEARKIPKDDLTQINTFCKQIFNEISSKYVDLKVAGLPPLAILGAAQLGAKEIHDGKIGKYEEDLSHQLFSLKQELSPDIVIAPFPFDPNTDHAVVGRVADWIFRSRECVWHYELPKMEGIMRHAFEPNLFINVGDKPEKEGSLNEYESYAKAKIFLFENVFQLKDGNKHWFDMKIFEGNMRIRAAQSFLPNTLDEIEPYVEAFEAKIYADTLE